MFDQRWYQEECVTALYNAVIDDIEIHPVVAVPTGAGKTPILCMFIDRYLSDYPNSRVLILSHVKEILEQNHDTLNEYFEYLDIGLYSSGLKSKTINKITVAGIQSVFRKPELFRDIDIVIVDECHLVTVKQTGMYRKFLTEIPARYVGLTATHFRLDHGYIHIGDNALFNQLCYNLTSVDNFNRLVKEGYLCKLIAKNTFLKMNTDVTVRAGDFVTEELSEANDIWTINESAINEVIKFGKNYKKWLIFAIDIKHALNLAQMLTDKGIKCAAVHSKLSSEERTEIIENFRNGVYRAVVNVNILTTGFNVPDIDLIAMLRPTLSPVLHVQSAGRGLRTAPGKDHCLILDFAGNTERLGPINDVHVRQKGEKRKNGEPLVKECPECLTLNLLAARFCEVCNYEFPRKSKLTKSASNADIVNDGLPCEQWLDIIEVKYGIHYKKDKPKSLRVDYYYGLGCVSEWVCLNHNGFPFEKAIRWVQKRLIDGEDYSGMLPTVDSVYEFNHLLKIPQKILVNFDNKYPNIKMCVFD